MAAGPAAHRAADRALQGARDAGSALSQSLQETPRPDLPDAAELRELLTVDGFDYDRVVEYVEQSDLNATVKVTTLATLERVRNSPELLRQTLERLRDELAL